MTGLPKRITPCPIHETILEIRFDAKAPRGAIFGLVYEAFSSDFGKVEELPIRSMPEQLRATDENLKFLPEYRLVGDEFFLLAGQRTFALATSGEYCGWEALAAKSTQVFERLGTLNMIDRIFRLGLRYINVFDFDLLLKSTLRIMLGPHDLKSRQTQLTAQIPAGVYESTLRVANNVQVKRGDQLVGESIIDIDTFTTEGLACFFEDHNRLIEGAHEEEKKLFFSLLSSDYLQSLNPEY